MTKESKNYNPEILQQTTQLQQQASNPTHSVFVSASAGSGKTKVLTDRVLRLLLNGVKPAKILCLTFTKVAASEMQNRIYSELSKWSYLPEEQLQQRLYNLTGSNFNKAALAQTRTLFAAILDDEIGLKINTIHSFCQNLMKKFPVEAKINPNFEIIDKQTENELLEEARRKLLNQALTDIDLAKKITFITAKLNENSFSEVIMELIHSREKLTSLKEKYFDVLGIIQKIYQILNYDPQDDEDIFDKYEYNDEGLSTLVLELARNNKKDAKIIADFIKNPSLEKLEQYKNIFLTKENEPRKKGSDITDSKMLKSAPILAEIIATEQKKIIEFINYLNCRDIALSTSNLLFVADKMLAIYADLKTKNGYMDYDDLISKAGNLLQNSENANWIKYKLDGAVEHVLIDESQDTNHYQWNIIKAITEDFFSGENAAIKERSIFVVGDDKQSIYSFQGADPKIFSDIFFYYHQKLSGVNSVLHNIQLNNSFRSYEAILKAVDLTFPKTSHRAIKTDYYGKVELWPVINIPKTKIKSENPFEWQINFEQDEEYKSKELLAKIIAKTIKKWLEEKRIIRNNGKPRPIRCGDIMILVRKRTNNLGNLLIKYLQQEQIAVRGSDKINLEKHIITQDLLSAAKFVLLPEDDLNLACLLKSPICGLSEEDLFDLCLLKNQQEISLFAALEKSAKMAGTFQQLQDLIDKNHHHQYQIYQLFSYILDIKNARKRVIERFGKEAEEIINQFLNLSLNYQHNNVSDLENFARYLENADLEVNIDLSSREIDEIRITTIHGSKGLEAPIIFLADSVHNSKNQFGQDRKRIVWANEKYYGLPFWPAGKNIDMINDIKKTYRNLEHEEYLRSLYVAMTRAEEELYISGFGENAAPDCWYNIIKNGIEPMSENKSFNFNEMLGEGEYREYLAAQGLVMEKNDINLSEIKINSDLEILEEEKLPEFINQIPTSEISAEVIYPSKLISEKLTTKSQSDKNFNLGKIVHKILEIVQSIDFTDLDAKKSLVEKYLQQNIYITEEEKEIISKQVFNILDNEKFRFLFSKNSKAEVPIIGKIDGKLISGKIDLLIINDDEIMIIDYKTGKSGQMPVLYSEQLLLYKKLLAKIYPGKEIKCAVIWTDAAQMDFIE